MVTIDRNSRSPWSGARKLLVKLLASMTSVDARIDFLMNLRDIVKEKK